MASAKTSNQERGYRAAVAYGKARQVWHLMRAVVFGLPMMAAGIFLLTLKNKDATLFGIVLLVIGAMIFLYNVVQVVLIRRSDDYAAAVGAQGIVGGAFGGFGGFSPGFGLGIDGLAENLGMIGQSIIS
jgi:hypothetical protein